MQSSEVAPTQKFFRKAINNPGFRFVIALAVTSTVTTGVIYASFINYWGATIYRTQSVDFNMLSAILPPTISPLLEKGDYKTIQKLIDSNYGLFGIVITECSLDKCSKEKIVAISDVEISESSGSRNFIPKSSYSKSSGWFKSLTSKEAEKNLKGELNIDLKIPAPFNQSWTFKTPRELKPQSTGLINDGRVIGKIYFLRNESPSFDQELSRWLSNIFSVDSWSWIWNSNQITRAGSASILYTGIAIAALLATLIIWILMEVLSYREVKLSEAKRRALEEQVRNYELTMTNLEQGKIIKLTEKELNNFKQYFEAVRGVISEDFVSSINTSAQIMQSILASIKGIVNDIVHDLKKAPLIQNSSEIENVKEITSSLPDNLVQPDIVQRQLHLLNDLQDTVETISWSMRGIIRLVEDKRDFDLIAELRDFQKNLPPKIHRECEISFQLYEQSYYIYGNPEQIRSIVKNAIYNSCTAVIKSNVPIPRIQVITELEDTSISIIIEDNGKGIPKEIIDKLYESEERISSNPMGGLGSMIVNSFLRLNGGTVHKANKPRANRGAIVKFNFPLVSSVPINSASI